MSIRVALFGLVIPVILAAQQPEELPRFRAGTNLVRVDAYVSKDDVAITDLTVDDFEVFEDDKPQKIVEPAEYGSGRCEQLYPSNSVPRGVAGAPVSADIAKCQLKPIDPADYKVTFAPEEMARLRRIFPDGVCDWSRPGVEQQRPTESWQTFNAPPEPQVASVK